MTLTVTENNSVTKWTGELSESDLMRVIHEGIKALYPEDAPTIDFEEAADSGLLYNGATLCCVYGGANTMIVTFGDVEG